MADSKKNENSYQICNRCVMDTTASDIQFDENGNCNYCNEFIEKCSGIINEKPVEKRERLNRFVKNVKEEGKGKPYDCIIGVSGGVDSSWVLVKAVELGLRPLAVHMDNGWNSELAQNNIERLVKELGVDLFTYVIDWNEFRDLQESFFDADVVDIELLTDNAIAAINYQKARKLGIKYIISGSNTATEGVRMPPTWAAINKHDKTNILNIWKQFGKGTSLKSFPIYGAWDYVLDTFFRKIEWVRFLDFLDYKKSKALEVLSSEYGYVPYPYKHYESIFTRLYQGIILPKKFNVDKRKNHLSALILSGEMSRDEAMEKLSQIPYTSQSAMEEDLQYFLKKFRWKRGQFKEYLKRPAVPHSTYGEEPDLLKIPLKIVRLLRSLKGSKA